MSLPGDSPVGPTGHTEYPLYPWYFMLIALIVGILVGLALCAAFPEICDLAHT